LSFFFTGVFFFLGDLFFLGGFFFFSFPLFGCDGPAVSASSSFLFLQDRHIAQLVRVTSTETNALN
jgi:hypothetical protein